MFHKTFTQDSKGHHSMTWPARQTKNLWNLAKFHQKSALHSESTHRSLWIVSLLSIKTI